MTAKTSHKEEIDNLKAKIRELEQKLSAKGKTSSDLGKKAVDSIGDAGNKIMDESGRIWTSMMDASLEAVQAGADAVSNFSKVVGERKSDDFSKNVMDAMRDAIDVQRKALDRFQESYDNYQK